MAPDILSTRDGGIATVTLFNPDKLNALNAAMWRRLAEVFAALDADESLRCVIVRGEGAAFAAGGDLDEMQQLRATVEGALAYRADVARALDAIASCRHPVVAQILGPCIGGGLEIACACDLRIAGESAKLGAPINRLGFSMYPGELASLLRLAGPTVVKEILLEGRLLTAREAIAVLEVGRVVDARGQRHHRPVAGARREGGEGIEQLGRVIIDRQDVAGLEQLGEQPLHQLAVFQHVGNATAGRLGGEALPEPTDRDRSNVPHKEWDTKDLNAALAPTGITVSRGGDADLGPRFNLSADKATPGQ